jgi:muramoyltetrapeptide carboxypeptidase
MSIVPSYLKPGDSVALIAPSRFMQMPKLKPFEEWVNSHGWQLVVSPNLGLQEGQLGGNDKQRLNDIKWALENPDIKAVFAARGGYGLIRLYSQLQELDFSRHPKWWVGFSDFTVMHALLFEQGVSSLHAPMAMQIGANIESNHNFTQLAQVLKGSELCLGFTEQSTFVNNKAKIWGGNLSMIYALLASGHKPQMDGCVLFLEELDEYLYHFDRMISALDANGIFEKVTAIAVGSIIEMHDNEVPFGKNAKQILKDVCSKHNKPLIWDLKVGHGLKNQPLKLGFACIFEDSELIQQGA